MIATTNLSMIPMRSEPSDKAEMINQILFGETFDIIEKQEKWSKIKLHFDDYEGWIDNKQYEILSTNISHKNMVTAKFLNIDNIIYPMCSMVDFETQKSALNIIETAKLFLETPYLWGGKTCFGIDCSGFTQMVFKSHNLKLWRDAYQQAEQGETIQLAETKDNDLAFFVNENQKIIHVGIIFKEKNQTKIIHAAGKVRIDILDKKGIFIEDKNTFSHQLFCIKRIV